MPTYTLLRYPGGKSRAIKHILPYFLKTGETKLVSPFFGGGAIELALINNGWAVRGYDNFSPVVNFWECILEDPERVANIVEMYRPVDPKAYKNMQDHYDIISCPFTQAAVFYVLNRTTHSGTGFNGGITKWSPDGTPDDPRLKDSTVKKLRNFVAPGLSVEKADFSVSIRKNPETILYCDPPYIDVGEMLYDDERFDSADIVQEKFDHELLAYCLNRRGNWILSYGEHDDVRRLYPDNVIIPLTWHHGMMRRPGSELLIFSKDLEHLVEIPEEEDVTGLTFDFPTPIIFT